MMTDTVGDNTTLDSASAATNWTPFSAVVTARSAPTA